MTSTLDHGIDTLFDEPWFTGSASASSADVPGVYQVAIDGHGYIIDPAGYSRVTVPLRRESTDESVEPGEQTLNTGGAWRRSQDNWFLGAGQEYLDNRFAFVSVYTHSGEDPSVRTRFWRSLGVNVWDEGALSLLPEYSKGVSSSTGPVLMATVGDYVYVVGWASGEQNLTQVTSSLTTTAITDPTGSYSWAESVTSLTTDGDRLFIACGSYGIAVLAPGTTMATWLRPAAPTPVVTPNGTPGTTTYHYYVVATDANGYKSLPSAVGTTTTGNATLSTGNYNEITWAAVEGAVSYDVLKVDSAHYMGAGTGAIKTSLGITGTSFTDDGSFTQESYTAPTATTQNFHADFVGYANSFLLAGSGPQLVSVGANGTTTLVMQHPNPNWFWEAGSGAPGNIYVAGSGSGKSELYGIQLSTTTFALGSPYIAGDVTAGETINDIAYYEGLVMLATSLGVRTAQASGTNGFLTMGPVITDLGPSECLAVYGSFCYFGVTDYTANDGVWQGTSNTSGLGRLSLSQYSSALIPAYATDVMSTTTGTVNSVAIIDGVPWFGLQNSGAWTPSGNLVPQGFLETGWVRYGTVEDKILVSTDVEHDPLAGTVSVEIVPFGGTSRLALNSTLQGSTGPMYYSSAGNQLGEAFMVIPILTRSTTDATQGPTLRRWTVRAMVTALRQDQIVCAIRWADSVLSPQGDGQVLSFDLSAEWDFLKDLETTGTPFIYQEGCKTYTCFIDQIELHATQWNDQRQMLEGILSVKLLTVV